jgi:probable rRNA maturation factor
MSLSDFDVQIRNDCRTMKVPVPFLRAKACQILKRLGWKKAALSILLVDDRKMRRLNRRHLNHNWTTDVLAFGQGEGPHPPKTAPFLGDLVISLPMAKRQARVYGSTFSYELCFYLCHGILHLMGYRDKTRKEAQKMERMQKKILKQVGVKN